MNVISFKEAKCKNCYKCVRTCSVKAIAVKDAQAQIIDDKCILCGQCLEACPQNAKTFNSDLEKVKRFLKAGIPTVVSIAPSYLGAFQYNTPGQVITALLKLGFSTVRETAEGAALVTEEYIKLLTAGTMENIITTSCPSANDLIEIYYPSLTKYMAPVVSPMIAHGKIIRKELGNGVKIVFLGPCIAKKREAERDPRTVGFVDAVINFSEVIEWLQEEQINVFDQVDTSPQNPNPMVNRLYPVSSGVISSVITTMDSGDSYRKFYVDGIDNCIELFKDMENGDLSNCFIEVNLCNGGCIKGPVVSHEPISQYQVKLEMEEGIPKVFPKEKRIHNEHNLSLYKPFCDRSHNDPLPTTEQINQILSHIGKTKPEDELNCGACGYSSCREKAIAVFQGKAEITMCIPYMHEKAWSMANVVLETTPNIILLVDSEMKIMDFSETTERYFHIRKSKKNDMYLYEILDPVDFEEVLNTHTSIINKKVNYPELNLSTLQSIVYVEKQDAVLGIFQDISKEEEANIKSLKVKMDTIEMAQKVIDKQMLVAQEIAGLLGETTAETKVTLTKLRDTILNE